jgi:hypothetical protein
VLLHTLGNTDTGLQTLFASVPERWSGSSRCVHGGVSGQQRQIAQMTQCDPFTALAE